jgi:hypothetical protein
MEDFKATIKKTQTIKNKIINSNLAFNKKKNYILIIIIIIILKIKII